MGKKENEVSGQPVKTWICSVCGYEHVGAEPPKECPRCGQVSCSSLESSMEDLHSALEGLLGTIFE